MNLLHTIGLMRRAEHEAMKRQNEGLLRDIKAERQRLKEAFRDLADQSDIIAELRPDAEKFRAKAKADAERKKKKRAATKRDQRP